MSVASWLRSAFTTQDPTTYKSAIDGNFVVLERVAAMFAPSQQATPNMTVLIRAGSLLNNSSLVEVAAQSTAAFTAPSTNPRIDRIVIDQTTGAQSVIAGTPAVSPVAPAIPAGKNPCCQVLLQPSSTTITNSMLTDERVFGFAPLNSPALTGTPTAPTAPAATGTTQLATTAYADAAATSASFPSGTRMSFQQTAAPAGWTKDTTAALNDSTMRIVTGTVGSGGTNGVSYAFAAPAVAGSTAGYILQIADIPSHQHGVNYNGGYASGTGVAAYDYGSGATGWTTAPTGGGGAHAHGAAGLTTPINVKYNDFIIASKN